jgi:uncharacterized membrane protein
MTTKLAKEIRAEAWKALGEGQYWTFFAGYMVLTMLVGVMTVPAAVALFAGVHFSGILPFFQPGGQPEIGLFLDPEVMLPLLFSVLAFSIIIVYPIGFICWGTASMTIATMRRGLKFGHAFSGWGHGWKMGWIVMVKFTYISLWSLLLYVPGIVKALSYAMTDFIAVDHPDWTANQCITESRRLMDGHKWRYFCLMVSFFGWFLLLILLSMLLVLVPMASSLLKYLFMPYFESAKAAFYEDLLDRDAVSGGRAEAASSSADVTDYISATNG